MKTGFKVVVGGILSGVALPLWALGLGDVQLNSYLGQPLRASIPLVGAKGVPADSIKARIGSSADFRRAGIPATPGLSDVQLKVDEHGRPHILLSSTKPLREPYLNLVVRVSWDGGERNVLRAYTLLFDPAPTAVASSGGPVGHPEPAHDEGRPRALGDALRTTAPAQTATSPTSAPAPTRPAPARKSAGSDARTFGPVKPQQTLWSIAKAVRPNTSVSMDQVVLALFDANRRKFDRGSINGLMHGVMLRVPTLEQMQAIPAATAHRRFESLLHHGAPKTAHPTASQPASPPAAKPAPEATVVSEPPGAPTSSAPTTPEPVTTQAGLKSARHAAAPASGTSATASTSPSTSASVAGSPRSAGEAETTGMATTATIAQAPAPTGSSGSAAVPVSTASVASPAAGASAAVPAAASSATAPAAAVTASKGGVSAAPMAAGSAPSATTPKPLKARENRPEFPLPWRIVLLGVAVILLLIWLAMRRRRQQPPIENLGHVALAPAADDADADADVASDTETAAATETPSTGAEEPVVGRIDDPPTEEIQTPEPVEDPVRETPASSDRKAPMDEPTPSQTPEVAAGESDDSAQDPLAEADFHLAYGLHDEAIALLQKALQSHPERRVELQMRLAEAYSGAGRREDFEHLASSLQHELNPEQQATLERLRDALGGAEPVAAEQAPDASPPNASPADGDAGAPADAGSGNEDPHSVEFRLDDFDAGARAPAGSEHAPGEAPEGEAPAFGGVDDENATKLDLARAYTDMAEHAAARTLLEEVLRDGNPPQQNEARELLRRLPG